MTPTLAPAVVLVLLVGMGSSGSAGVERLQGLYLQQAVELTLVGDRMVRLTRMTKFWRCGVGRPRAEDLNGHTVEVLGREVPSVGFVAGIVNAIEGCRPPTDRWTREPGER